jgi:hypothetical protein
MWLWHVIFLRDMRNARKTWKKDYGWKITYRYQDNISMDFKEMIKLILFHYVLT